MGFYGTRRDECLEAGCDCESYTKPTHRPKVYRCSECNRMVTRVYRSYTNQRCNDCNEDE